VRLANCRIGGSFAMCSSLVTLRLRKRGQDNEEYAVIPRQLCEGCKALKSIKLQDGITRIDARAFWGCENLEKINIPDSVEFIHPTAFEGCHRLSSNTKDAIASRSDKKEYDEKLQRSLQYIHENGLKDYWGYAHPREVYRMEKMLRAWHDFMDPYLDYPVSLPKLPMIYYLHMPENESIDLSAYGWKQQKTFGARVGYVIIDTDNLDLPYGYLDKLMRQGEKNPVNEAPDSIEEEAVNLKKTKGRIKIVPKSHVEKLMKEK